MEGDIKDANYIEFNIESVDIHTDPQTITIWYAINSQSPSFDLMHQEYIGNNPNNPSIAVSFKTMELFRRIRRRKPGFSVEAFAKVVYNI